MLKIWFVDEGTARQPAREPVIALWGVWEELCNGIAMWSTLFPMNNCKDGKGSLEGIVTGREMLLVLFPEQCWPTPWCITLYPLLSIPWEKDGFNGGNIQERKHIKWLTSHRPLKASLTQCLQPGLKFPCPIRILASSRRPESRKVLNGLRKVQGTSEVLVSPTFFLYLRWNPNQLCLSPVLSL